MELNYTVIYAKRKTLTVTVERDRSVVVRAPEGTSPEKIRQAVESKKLWLYEKTRHPQKYKANTLPKEFVSGESMLYLGRYYRLEVVESAQNSIQFANKFIVSRTSRQQARQLFREWYMLKAREKITPRAKYHARNLGVHFNKIMVSDLKYRWGSCTPKDNLNFNWRLIKAPMPVIDYVIVHELTHLLESNHTPRFWTIVKVQIPAYQKAKVWLMEYGGLLEQDI